MNTNLFVRFVLLMAIGLSFGCENQGVENINGSFEGLIGSYPVILELDSKDGELTGRYSYKKNAGNYLYLKGTENSSGNFTLFEFEENRKQSGSFSGRYDGENIAGIWRDPDNTKSFAFFLDLVKDKSHSQREGEDQGVENSEPEEYMACQFKIIKEEKKTDNWTDDCFGDWEVDCGEITVEYPIITNLNESIRNSLNSNIINKLLEHKVRVGDDAWETKYYTSIDDFLESELETGSTTIKVEVVRDKDYILTLRYFNQFFSGAHPFTSIAYFNLNTKAGNWLSLDNLFVSGYKSELYNIGEDIFVQQLNNGNSDLSHGEYVFPDGKFYLNSQFEVTDKSLVFRWGQYELGAYAQGMAEIYIPFKSIVHLLDPNGLLGYKIDELKQD